jgi:Ser-tRNA(Ala) deacylase AlaX
MAINVSALDNATSALTEPMGFRHRARIFKLDENLVSLDRTNFFPNLSGQPCDRGTIVRISDHQEWAVVNVNFDGRDVWHDITGSPDLQIGD